MPPPIYQFHSTTHQFETEQNPNQVGKLQNSSDTPRLVRFGNGFTKFTDQLHSQNFPNIQLKDREGMGTIGSNPAPERALSKLPSLCPSQNSRKITIPERGHKTSSTKMPQGQQSSLALKSTVTEKPATNSLKLGITAIASGEIAQLEDQNTRAKIFESDEAMERLPVEITNEVVSPLTNGQVDIEKILSTSSLPEKRKASIRDNCQWLLDHGVQSNFVANVAKFRVYVAEAERERLTIEDVLGEDVPSEPDTNKLPLGIQGFDPYDLKDALINYQHEELEKLCENCEIQCVPSPPPGIDPKITEEIQRSWTKGEISMCKSLRDVVNERILPSGRNSASTPNSEIESISKSQTLQKLSGNKEEELLNNLTFLYAVQQEIFASANFLGKIDGSPPAVMATRKVTAQKLPAMVGEQNYKGDELLSGLIYPASKAYGAESWSILVSVDDGEIMEGGDTIGGNAMIVTKIPTYEIGMSCVGMRTIYERGQREIVRYPFSDLPVKAHDNVGHGFEGQNGMLENEAYRNYQYFALAELLEKP
jgi:hypothetical protein